MDNALSYEQIVEMVPAYVLGVLEPDEMLAVDAYIRQHENLMARLRQSEESVAQLAHVAPTTPLPVEVKSRLMQRVRADQVTEVAPLPKVETTLPSQAPLRPQPAASKPALTAGPGWQANLRAFFTWPGWAAATGLAILLLLLIGLYAGQLQNNLRQSEANYLALQNEIDRLELANNRLTQDNQQLQQQVRAEQGRFAFVRDAAANEAVLLLGTEAAPDAVGTFRVEAGNRGELALLGLPELNAQETYQLWLIQPDNTPVSVGLVNQMDAPVEVAFGLAEQNFVAVGVSREPAGGSPAPTTIVLLGKVG